MKRRRGFTLTEMMIVMGLIIVLVALLVPTVEKMRQAAASTTCSTRVRTIGQALLAHAADHRGYMPLAGFVSVVVNGVPVPANSDTLGDHTMVKYDYYLSGSVYQLMPMEAALAPYFNVTVRNDTILNMQADILEGTIRKTFTCPSDDNNRGTGATGYQNTQIWDNPATYGVLVFSSYNQNAECLGWNTVSDHSRCRGSLTAMVNPARVMLIGDGKPPTNSATASTANVGEFYVNANGQTLNDCFVNTASCGSSNSFDTTRHGGAMNICFVDGQSKRSMGRPRQRKGAVEQGFHGPRLQIAAFKSASNQPRPNSSRPLPHSKSPAFIPFLKGIGYRRIPHWPFQEFCPQGRPPNMSH